MKKVCVVTAARSEYGLLRWTIDALNKSKYFDLDLVVTGSHLLEEYGLTIKEIESDGFEITERIDIMMANSTKEALAKSMGICSILFSSFFERSKPDILLVLGDRYELLPICSTALIMGIPIAHISGGDVTTGALDDQIRHSISKMATLHFPGCHEAEKRLVQMGEERKRIFMLGEPGLENLLRLKTLCRCDLSESLCISVNKKWILFTYHPETNGSLSDDLKRIKVFFEYVLKEKNYVIVCTAANSDFGGYDINKLLKEYSKLYPQHVVFVRSLGQLRYTSMLKEAYCMVGNSSSGIVESGIVGLPVINIGDRQRGRVLTPNIINSDGSTSSINKAFKMIKNAKYAELLKNLPCPYGDGNFSQRIIEVLSSGSLTLNKGFVDYE